jgi:hypothetical protein
MILQFPSQKNKKKLNIASLKKLHQGVISIVNKCYWSVEKFHKIEALTTLV